MKALVQLESVHYAQARNYLEAYNLEMGLLINFGLISLEFKSRTNSKFVDHLLFNLENPPKSSF